MPSLRLLITRPHPDASPLAERLAALGHRPLIDPLMHVKTCPGPELDLTGVQALAVTSANGVRAFADRTTNRRIAVFAVGEASAREARSLAFTTVNASTGSVDRLAADIVAALDPGGGAVFHAAGRTLAGDLKGHLEAAGFTVRRETLYETVAATDLAPETVKALKSGDLDAVLLYSPRTGRIFAELLRKAQLNGAATRLTAICLSTAVADTVRDLPWAALEIAGSATEKAVLAILRSIRQGC